MKEKKDWTKFLIQEITVTVILMIAVAAVVVFVDPFFHYHAPVEGISYILDNERYQNDGIVRNYEYDCLITGTSEGFWVTKYTPTPLERISLMTCSILATSAFGVSLNRKCASSQKKTILGFSRSPTSGSFS